jgi:hypothetical protein
VSPALGGDSEKDNPREQGDSTKNQSLLRASQHLRPIFVPLFKSNRRTRELAICWEFF